jgi:Uma2 family endonuclease
MATATAISLVEPHVRLLTVADLAALPSDLPSGTVLYELDNGKLVILPLPGFIHGVIELRIAEELRRQGERRGLGIAHSGDAGIILWRNPDRVAGPDAAFIANSSLPVRLSKEGYLETIPHLVVELRSKNDSQPAVDAKVHDYLKAGVKVVWVADHQAKTVTAYRSDQPPHVFTEADTLTVEDIIPGFAVPLRAVFQI